MLLINELHRHNNPLREELIDAIQAVVDSGWYILGKNVEEFENDFADFCHVDHCISVASGTDALELSLRAIGVQQGDEVITVANAGGYSTAAILAIGAVPSYIDVDDASLLIDSNALPGHINECTKAVVVTHLYGRVAPMDKIMNIAASAGVPVLEDCAQAHGASINNRPAGSWGTVGCFSFYPTKNLGALGDGGAIITKNEALAKTILQIRQYGWDKKYCSTIPGGRNSRLDEMQAAILNVKLRYLEGWNQRRTEIAQQYNELINHPLIELPILDDGFVSHLYVIRSVDRQKLREYLEGRGIASDIHYPIPDYHQPGFGSRFACVTLTITERACQEVLSLPCFPEMTDAEVVSVAEAVNAWGL